MRKLLNILLIAIIFILPVFAEEIPDFNVLESEFIFNQEMLDLEHILSSEIVLPEFNITENEIPIGELNLIADTLTGTNVRYVQCDPCGFCITPPPQQIKSGIPTVGDIPRDWLKCKQCLYNSQISDDPRSFDTLRIDENSTSGPTPFPGSQYTTFGCIQTIGASRDNPDAPSSLVNSIMRIIFTVMGATVFLYFSYGAYLTITANGDEMEIQKGRIIIIRSIIGLLFIIFTVFIISIIAGDILSLPSFNK